MKLGLTNQNHQFTTCSGKLKIGHWLVAAAKSLLCKLPRNPFRCTLFFFWIISVVCHLQSLVTFLASHGRVQSKCHESWVEQYVAIQRIISTPNHLASKGFRSFPRKIYTTDKRFMMSATMAVVILGDGILESKDWFIDLLMAAKLLLALDGCLGQRWLLNILHMNCLDSHIIISSYKIY